MDSRAARLIALLTVPAVLFFLFYLPFACGQDKSLFWQDFSVQARLDNDGRLHVEEQQTIVFDGDWNGGERTFMVRPGQTFRFEGLFRYTEDGLLVELEKGNLAQIDHYGWHGKHTLRWRSRLPGDPPFDHKKITYILKYSLAKILTPAAESGFILNHDFAFTDRSGSIKNFSLNLSVDDAWNQEGMPLAMTKSDIAPGRGVTVKITLNHLRGGPSLVLKKPSSASAVALTSPPAAPSWLISIGGVLLLLQVIGCSISFFLHERAARRFSKPPAIADIDDQWLRRHVFSLLPETVGATWDKKTTGHEVAAVLARLVVEEKMSSRLEPVVIPFFGWHIPGQYTLHLDLLVARSHLSGYARELIDGLFIDGDTTDTKRIRAYYRKKGSSFQPAAKLRQPLDKRVRQLTRALKNPLEFRWLIALCGAVIAFFLLLANAFIHQGEVVATISGGFVGLTGIIIGSAAGIGYRNRSDGLLLRIILLHLFIILVSSGFLGTAWAGASTLLTCAVFFLCSTVIYVSFYCAKTRDSLEGVMLCKKLTAARTFFKRELKKDHPAIRDEWFPYLLAFGLGPDVDKWTRQFMGSGIHHSPYSGQAHSSQFTGGGGSFGGAGASGAWAAAATAVGSSASSSSGGSSGGGSSGGGGGGGW